MTAETSKPESHVEAMPSTWTKHRLTETRGFVAQIGRRACYPFPQTDLAYWLSDGDAKSSVAVEDGDTDLDLCDLPIKVPRHQRLAE